MSEKIEVFQEIIANHKEAVEGTMYGSECIKTPNRVTVAILWKGDMMIKLCDPDLKEALKIDGAKPGYHLYDETKAMNSWVFIPGDHSDQWETYVGYAIDYGLGRRS